MLWFRHLHLTKTKEVHLHRETPCQLSGGTSAKTKPTEFVDPRVAERKPRYSTAEFSGDQANRRSFVEFL